MALLYIVLACFTSSILQYQLECRKLDGYKFPVYTTENCPRNKSEWNQRSSYFNCTMGSAYACFPNDDITELIEFCYPLIRIAIPRDVCLHLTKRRSEMNIYNCRTFDYGCPDSPYFGSSIYEYPSCVTIGDGCFLAESSCRSATTTSSQNVTTQETSTKPHTGEGMAALWIILAITLTFILIIPILFITQRQRKRRKVPFALSKRRKLKKTQSIELEEDLQSNLLQTAIEETRLEKVNVERDIPKQLQLIQMEEKDETYHSNSTENVYERDIFAYWQNEDEVFIETVASKEVDRMLSTQNCVIVAGHSGSGKTAIVQHIALKYREQGCIVKHVDLVQEINSIYESSKFIKKKTLFVLNDPIGKESLDALLYSMWRKFEEKLEVILENAKLLMSCRKSLLKDTRVQGLFKEKLNVIIIDDDQNALSSKEKRQILKRHNQNTAFAETEIMEILKIDTYFPLSCKLFANNGKHCGGQLTFLSKLKEVYEREIQNLALSNKETYCGLVCLVLFKNKLSSHDMIENDKLFKECLDLCDLPIFTSPATIIKNLKLHKDFLVKKIGDTYHFYNDFVMDVTTYVFGKDYPVHAIRYADIAFLRRRLRLEEWCGFTDSFVLTLDEKYTSKLAERLFQDMFQSRFMEVVLNPCLRNAHMVNAFIEKLHQDKKMLFLMEKKIEIEPVKHSPEDARSTQLLSRLDFVTQEKTISPLFALIAFCHDELSLFCLKELKKATKEFSGNILFLAVCSDGSKNKFNVFAKKDMKLCFKQRWGSYNPIDILSLFHNHELLKIVLATDYCGQAVDIREHFRSPLLLAFEYDEQNNQNSGTSRQSPRYKTIEVLLDHGYDVNCVAKNGNSPIYMASKIGHDTAVELLLYHDANVNSCNWQRDSALSAACENGHYSTVNLLLQNGADSNFCDINGVSPLIRSCKKGQVNTVQLLLRAGADANACDWFGDSPLCLASERGHESIVDLLLIHGADKNLSNVNGVGPLFKACEHGHATIVTLLLTKDDDINLCDKYGNSPLSIACENGHKRIVEAFFLQYDINLVNLNNEYKHNLLSKASENGHDEVVQILLNAGINVDERGSQKETALYQACKNGHDSTVQVLIENGASLNLRSGNGDNPLCIACERKHENIAKLLLTYGADVNFCDKTKTSPLYIACKFGYENITQLLLSKHADVDLCDNYSVSPLYRVCEIGNDRIVQLLLNNGANVNLCDTYGDSPLSRVCEYGYDSIVELLLTKGADVNLPNNNKETPLYKACENGHDNLVQLLLKNRAEVNLCDKKGISPLSIACENGHDAIVQRLLQNGAKVNLCDNNRVSPLSIACEKKHTITVNILLENGANVNLCDKDGISPLYIACAKGYTSILELLLPIAYDFSKTIHKV